ncbi:protein FAM177A1-like isoform X2 [Kryptolebias marmoratus]|uniref:Family with sequence similarity 177 member A1 n=1 Tax=Kryptolebias marmoratus TaxID=37003 RepID=A0A3Q3A2D1_KRYMA|nr:protein FAM177A1-like isoform X2 [Kryptolebias marmoratus]
MADISLYLTNVNVSVGRTVDAGQSRSPHPGKDPDSVELELEAPQREKAPRRIIHFSSGETMEEYSTDDDDEEEGEEREAERKDLLSPPVDASKMPWGPYFWFHMWRAATSTISACDYLGERMASLFGITSAKYQYAIDEYYRIKKEKEEEAEGNRLSEEAERSFGQVRSQEQKDEAAADAAAGDGGQDAAAEEAARPTTTYQVENESRVNPNTITVPVIVTAT